MFKSVDKSISELVTRISCLFLLKTKWFDVISWSHHTCKRNFTFTLQVRLYLVLEILQHVEYIRYHKNIRFDSVCSCLNHINIHQFLLNFL